LEKRYAKRAYDAPAVVKRVERSYSRDKKLQVLDFLLYHRVPKKKDEKARRGQSDPPIVTTVNKKPFEPGPKLRAPTFKEAALHFKVPTSTIALWWANRYKVIIGTEFPFRPKHPVLEEELFNRFIAERKAGKIIRVGWFRRNAREIHHRITGLKFPFTTIYGSPRSS